MSTAEVISQFTEFHKLLITILFNTRVRLFKVVDSHHVHLQEVLQAALLRTVATLIWLCFLVHHLNMPIQISLVTELF